MPAPMRRVDLIVVHCSASPSTRDIGVKEIRVWHLDRGFAGIGYHYVIRLNGVTERGRSEDIAGAHAEGYNAHSIGICLVGGLNEDGVPADTFTSAQYETLKALLSHMRDKYPNAYILGHRDLPRVKKECPCFDVRAWCKVNGINAGE